MVNVRRIPFITRCTVVRGSECVEAMLCSLSVLDAYLVVEPPLNEGELVRLRFVLPLTLRAVECEAEVGWVKSEHPRAVDSLPPGCSLLFRSMRAQDRDRIAALVDDYRLAQRPRIVRPLPHSGFTRIPYVQPCLIDGTSRGVTCNISVVGLYVAVDPIPSYGATASVSMRLPGLDMLVETPAVVAWVNPDQPVQVEALPPGCGLRFSDLPGDVGQVITAMVESFLSVPREPSSWLEPQGNGEPG